MFCYVILKVMGPLTCNRSIVLFEVYTQGLAFLGKLEIFVKVQISSEGLPPTGPGPFGDEPIGEILVSYPRGSYNSFRIPLLAGRELTRFPTQWDAHWYLVGTRMGPFKTLPLKRYL